MKEQELENKAENDKRMPEANCACTLEMCGEERIKREICMNILEKLLMRNEAISPRLSAMINKEINDSLKRINNSIKDAEQTLVKCPMEEEKPCSKSKGISDACRSHALEEHCKESFNICNRQITCHASRQHDNLSRHDDSYQRKQMHENAIPLLIQNKINNERKSKKYLKSENNVNHSMTGNVYIYSETNDNDQGRKKSRHQSYMDKTSNIITESNSKSTRVSRVSLSKLINSIKEKRKELIVQLPNFIHEKSNDDNTIHDNRTLQYKISRKELSEANTKEEADVEVDDENATRCKDRSKISSTKDGCCEDTDSIDLQQNSSYLTVPCSNFSTCDNIRHPKSWIMYSSKARLDDNDVFLTGAICTNMEQGNYRKNNDRDNNVRRSEYSMCHAVDGSRWLPKSIYTECAYGGNPKECFAAGCKYRNKIFQDSVINRNDIRRKQIRHKLLQQSLRNYQREQVTRQWSACSCIAEENEDNCKDVDKDKKELPQNICNVTECLEKISVCRTPRKIIESATTCETSLGAGKHFEKTRTCKDSEEYSKDISVCETKFGNSDEPPKVTRVCEKFVTEELPEDITVCKTVFGEPNRLPEEIIVYKTVHSDSKDIPKETICKEIPDLNFTKQDDVNKVSLNDANIKLVEENTNSNLNDLEGNAGNKRIVKLNNKHDNVILNSFTRQQSANVEQTEQINKTLNDQSNNLHRISIESIQDFELLSKNDYCTLSQLNRSNLLFNSSEKKTSKIVNQRRTQSLNRSMRNFKNHFQQLNDLTPNLTSNKNNQLEEKTQRNSQEEEGKKIKDISKEMKMTENEQRESLLHRPFKTLIDIIRRKTFIIDRIEEGKTEAKRTIADGKNNVEISEIASEIEDKTNNIKDQQEIKKVTLPTTLPQTKIADKEINSENLEKILRDQNRSLTDFIIPEKGKKIDVQKTNQTMPKLLRVIAAKRSHGLPIVVTTDSKPEEPEVLSVPAEIITAYVEQKKNPEEKITLREHSPVEITKEIEINDLIVPEMSVAIEASVEDALKEVADEDRVPQDILDETIKTHVACLQKNSEEKSQNLILCKCGLPSDSSDCSCLISKCIKESCEKKSEEKPQKSTLCKRELSSNSNNYSYSIVKCTKCNSLIENCLCKDKRFEQKKIYCARCRLSTMQCICTSYLKNCLKTDKSEFRASPLDISSRIYTNCCIRKQKERKYDRTICCYSHEECKWCATHEDCSRITDKYKCKSRAICINCGRPRNQYCCAKFTLVKCHKEACNRKRTTICLYCDNSQDKCTCKTLERCLYCGLPLDVCNCQDDEGHVRDCEHIVKRPNENLICVTSWKPKRENRRHYARNFEASRPYSIKECRCYEKSKRQYPQELPYQRLNIFSEVMNELQQKMSESVCCARCWRNPCCCGLPVDQDKRKEKRKAKNRVKVDKKYWFDNIE